MPNPSLTSVAFPQSRPSIRFRAILLASMFSWLITSACAQEVARRPQPLTNQDVIDMVGLELTEGVIIAKINAASTTACDTTVLGLRALKAAKVGDVIIRAMINVHRPSAGLDQYAIYVVGIVESGGEGGIL